MLRLLFRYDNTITKELRPFEFIMKSWWPILGIVFCIMINGNKMKIQGVKILSATPKDQDNLVTRGSERIANYILWIYTTFIRCRWMYSMIDNISGTNHAKALRDTLNSIVVVRYIKSDLVTWTRWVFINTICPKPDYKYIDTG